MATPQEQRQIRLANDYKEMLNIRGEIINWRPLKGEPPHIEEYELTIKIKTIVSSQPEYRNQHNLKLVLSEKYPNVAPQIYMLTSPPPFHPNWYTSGLYCSGSGWDISEGLGDHVNRMIRTLQFELGHHVNPNSAANRVANDWFLANQDKNLFPCDQTSLPDPTKSRFEIKQPTKKKFEIK